MSAPLLEALPPCATAAGCPARNAGLSAARTTPAHTGPQHTGDKKQKSICSLPLVVGPELLSPWGPQKDRGPSLLIRNLADALGLIRTGPPQGGAGHGKTT